MAETWRMRALCQAGRIILENGGETYRAEDTVIRMAQALGLKAVSVFAVPSGLFISYTDENDEQCTSVTRSYLKNTYLCRIDKVNQISRNLVNGSMKPDELLPALEEAENLCRQLPSWYEPALTGVIAAGFAISFGGGVVDCIIGALCAVLTQLLSKLWKTAGIGILLPSTIFCAMIPLLFQALTGLGNPEVMIAASIMPLVPGLSMTNAVQDLLRGDMISGTAHASRAVITAALITGGTLLGTHLFNYLNLPEQKILEIQGVSFTLKIILIFVGSCIATIAFGGFLYAPRKGTLLGGILGGACYSIYSIIQHFQVSGAVAMFVGAFLAALIGQLFARKTKMISTIFIALAIIPLVPGLGLSHTMNLFAQGQTGSGLAVAFSTMAQFLMIALGVGCGSAMAEVSRKIKV